MFGTTGADTLAGTAGNDRFYGKGGGDLLSGGAGDDQYVLGGPADRVVEGVNAGVDTITAYINISLTDFNNVENVNVDADGKYAGGNALDNVIQGGAGAQQLYGAAGQDVLVGGAGADIFMIYKGEGNDAIADFDPAVDRVRLKAGYTSFAQVQSHLSQQGADVVLDMLNGSAAIFRNLTVGQLSATNFQLQLDLTQFGAPTFADEFNGPLSLWDAESNPGGTWRPDYHHYNSQNPGHYSLTGNGEKQQYTSPYYRDHPGDFAESPFVSNPDGTVSIWAKQSTNPEIFGYGYTSGFLSTRNTFSQTYGYFEMRAKVPDAAGTWPAFWMDRVDGKWPPELDIMEILGDDPRTAWNTEHSSIGGHTKHATASFTPDTADGFHTYGALWTPTQLVWYMDGVEAFRTATPTDMNSPMFMMANMALGGWAGWVDNAALPAEMKIDYIRAYALPAAYGGSGSPPAPVTPPPAPTPPAPTPPAPTPPAPTPPAPTPPAPTPPVSTPPASTPPASGPSSAPSAAPSAPPAAPSAPAAISPALGGHQIDGLASADRVLGSAESDYMRGMDGDDSVDGGLGDDDVNGNQGSDSVQGGAGADWARGGQGDDVVDGGEGDDPHVNGNLGADSVFGGDGDDKVFGGQGDDTVYGDVGNDTLSGDKGNDILIGGAGADQFVFRVEGGQDWIMGFNAAEGDRIQLAPGTSYTIIDVGGQAVIDLGNGAMIGLAGVSISAMGDWLTFG